MATDDNTARALPDDAHQAQAQVAGTLDWVGMDGIQAPLMIADADGQTQRVAARIDAHVNLHRPEARGIHMSRLYLLVEQALTAEPLAPCMLRKLLNGFLETHADLSDRARLRIRFEHLLRRSALKSEHSGWRSYPVTVTATMCDGEIDVELAVDVVYSSTCPASASLSRQLIQQQFAKDFADGEALDRAVIMDWLGSAQGMVATPHAQRSTATLRLRMAPAFGFALESIIDRVEDALGTPVQTAVKREDEQAFALANGQNLMFCEDAARRIQAALNADERIADFAVRVAHHESLHPHDAVAHASKGVREGYRADAFDD
ncbi:GTP cyclohydrolase FolE2 [Oleiagrimonas sp. MCCC 1A03011]|uniref:GTP cyclohydrolase FolE2 n=1 Tax=Oleiagrimonas sp. MCCC 1A03011 TaxID=1926883 RepID=UPI000DC59A12|nr:GTP cyclohydrolase FolE2 [Oleiagrimonas sp. MCCC 1A03011]RAP56368.1 GTP cyclohydrolase [Oleiagrimonas sp. MCCC 1A03011]